MKRITFRFKYLKLLKAIFRLRLNAGKRILRSSIRKGKVTLRKRVRRIQTVIRAQMKLMGRKALKLGHTDVVILASRSLEAIRFQLKYRPRIRLFGLVIFSLMAMFFASNYALAYLRPREAEVKIYGQSVLVAEPEVSQSLDEVEIQQEVSAKISPFEFAQPVDSGQVSQGFRSYHQALDIATTLGTPIHPVGAGVVEFAGFTADGKGNIVVVDHGDNLKSLYAHIGKINVGVGNQVDAKTIIGTVGLTGRTTGAHVHFEVIDRGNAVNPQNVLPE